MKTIFGLALIVTIVACGNDDNNGATEPAAQSVALRLLGVGSPGPVHVQVAALQLNVDGHALAATPNGGELNLGSGGASDVTTFDLPPDASRIAMTLQFQPEGRVELNGNTQVLDLRGPPITLVADAAQSRTHSQVVVEIDLAVSLIDDGERVVFLPYFAVRY